MEILLQDRFLVCLIAGLFGSIFGSFATALIYRLPRDINWISKRSSCTNCNKNLSVPDLFPIFSYILSGGKCRYCGVRYGAKYFIVEMLVTSIFVLSFYFFPAGIKPITLSLLGFAIIVLSQIDFEHYIIPDEVNIFIFILGVIFSLVNNISFVDILINSGIYLTVALFLRWLVFFWKKKEGLGLGDVKFFVAAGVFLSIELLPVFLFVSGMSGIIIAIFWRIIKKSDIFPFGPALSISLFFCVAFPEAAIKFIYKLQEIIY